MIKCALCDHKEFKNYSALGIHIVRSHHISTKEYYDIYLKKDENEGICPICGNETTFKGLGIGYLEHCSTKCMANNPKIQDKIEQTFIDRYGGIGTGSKEIKEKILNTTIQKYGGMGFKSDNISEKIAKTNLEKYGVEYSWQREDVKEKIKETNLERYGVDNVAKSKEIQEKIKQTNLDHYGVTCIFQLDTVREQTNKIAWSEEVREKRKVTTNERYGVDYICQAKEVKEKAKQTLMERYGVENPMQSREIRLKATQTLHENGNSSSLEDYIEDKLIKLHISYEKQYKESRYPYFCDFYLPDIDTFIEINGYWMHCEHFFDENNEEDKQTLKIWMKKAEEGHKQYKYAIKIWTSRDIEKRDCAIRNNLNYIVLWNKQDIEEFVNKLSQERGSVFNYD